MRAKPKWRAILFRGKSATDKQCLRGFGGRLSCADEVMGMGMEGKGVRGRCHLLWHMAGGSYDDSHPLHAGGYRQHGHDDRKQESDHGAPENDTKKGVDNHVIFPPRESMRAFHPLRSESSG